MNDKGFAISAFIYSALIIFSILLLTVLTILEVRKNSTNEVNKIILDEFNEQFMYNKYPEINFISNLPLNANIGQTNYDASNQILSVTDYQDVFIDKSLVDIDYSGVNFDEVGTYEIIFEVTDSDLNKTTISKDIIIDNNDNFSSVLLAVNNYYTNNMGLLPSEGNTEEVIISLLQSEGYLPTLIDPYYESVCDGYVLTTNIDGEYNHIPHLKCGDANYIINTDQDGLIAHYNFDDFEEPTVNGGDLSSSISLLAGLDSDWDLEYLDEDTIKVTALVDNPLSGVYGNITNNISALYNVNAYETVTYSCEVVDYSGSLFRIFPSTNGWGTLIGYGTFNDIVYRTITHSVPWGHAMVIRIADSSNIYAGDYIVIKNTQIEKKDYPTFHTEGTRTGVVKDFSINNNITTLGSVTTPRWMEVDGNGTYFFNGEATQIISDDNISPTGSQTFSAWINPSSLPELQGFVGFQNHTTTSNITLASCYSKLCASIGYTDGTREWDYKKSLGSVTIGEWSFVSLVYDEAENKIKFYIDGVFDKEYLVSGTIDFTNESLLIGNWSTTYLNDVFDFNGYIDDVKIYNRALLEDELYYDYMVNSSKYGD